MPKVTSKLTKFLKENAIYSPDVLSYNEILNDDNLGIIPGTDYENRELRFICHFLDIKWLTGKSFLMEDIIPKDFEELSFPAYYLCDGSASTLPLDGHKYIPWANIRQIFIDTLIEKLKLSHLESSPGVSILKYNISYILQNRFVIYVNTKKSDMEIRAYLNQLGRLWNSGNSYLDITPYCEQDNGICYLIAENEWRSSPQLLSDKSTPLIEWEAAKFSLIYNMYISQYSGVNKYIRPCKVSKETADNLAKIFN